MKKTILQTHIDLLNECKRQNQMLEKLIELNMNDLQDIVDQRDWYYDRYRQLKDKYNKYEQEEVIPESFWEALVEVKDKDIKDARELYQTAMELSKKYKDERDGCQVEQDRALKAWTEAVSERTAALLERDEYKIGHDRYEKLRRLNLREMKELYLKHLHTLEHFDTLVDKLCQVK